MFGHHHIFQNWMKGKIYRLSHILEGNKNGVPSFNFPNQGTGGRCKQYADANATAVRMSRL